MQTVPFSTLNVGDIFKTNIDFKKSRVRYSKITPQPQTYDNGIWNAYNLSSKRKVYIKEDREVYLYTSLDTMKQVNGGDGESLIWNPEQPPEDTVRRYPPEETNEN